MSKNFRYNKPKKPKIGAGYEPPYDAALLAKPIEDLGLSEEVLAIVKKGGVNTLQDVAVRRDTDMYKMQNFNKKCLFELRQKLAGSGVDFRPKEEAPAADAAPAKNEKRRPDDRQRQPEQRPDRRDKNDRGDRKDRGGRDNKQRQSAPAGPSQKRERPRFEPIPKEPADRYVKVNKGGQWGFQERESGKMAVEPQFDELYTFREELCCAEKGEHFGFIDREGNVVVPFDYECALSFSEGYAAVGKKGMMGYIDKTNQLIVPFEYEAATSFQDGEARVKKDGKWGALTLEKQENGVVSVCLRWIN